MLLAPKIRFAMFLLCPMSLSPLPLKSGGEGGVYFCHFRLTHAPERLGIFT